MRHLNLKYHKFLFSGIIGCLFLCIPSVGHASLIGTQGEIKFDVQADGTSEMVLNTQGLGIGENNPSANLHVSGNVLITDQLIIGGGSSSDNLHVFGTIAYSPTTFTTSGNINNIMNIVDTSSDTVVLHLPYAGNALGQMITVKQIAGSNGFHLIHSGNYIENYFLLTPDGSVARPSIQLFSDGTIWQILGLNGVVEEYAAANLMIWWRLDETSGTTTQDFTVFGRNGTLTNQHSFSGNSLPGILVNALGLDDIDDRLQNTAFTPTLDTYSYNFWTYGNTNSNSKAYYNGNIQGVLGFSWSSNVANWNQAAYHQLQDGSYVQSNITATISANTWHNIAATWDGQWLTTYLDGAMSGNVAAANLMAPSGNLEITAPGSSGRPNQRFDEFRFYNRVLSSSEIELIYNSGAQQ